MIGQRGIELHLGDKIHYKSKSMIHPEATYEGVVVGVYKYFYDVLGTPIRSTMNEKNTSFWGDAVPYRFSIPKYLDIDQERVRVLNDITLEELAEKIA